MHWPPYMAPTTIALDSRRFCQLCVQQSHFLPCPVLAAFRERDIIWAFHCSINQQSHIHEYMWLCSPHLGWANLPLVLLVMPGAVMSLQESSGLKLCLTTRAMVQMVRGTQDGNAVRQCDRQPRPLTVCIWTAERPVCVRLANSHAASRPWMRSRGSILAVHRPDGGSTSLRFVEKSMRNPRAALDLCACYGRCSFETQLQSFVAL